MEQQQGWEGGGGGRGAGAMLSLPARESCMA